VIGKAVPGEQSGGENFLLAILPVLLYQIRALLGGRELGGQYGQQGAVLGRVVPAIPSPFAASYRT